MKSNPSLDKPKTIEKTPSPEHGQSPDRPTPEPSERVISEEENKVVARIEKFRRDFGKYAVTTSKVNIANHAFNQYRKRFKRKYPDLDWRDLGK